MATTAERIQKLRKEFGLDQGQLARALKVSKDTVGSWERGIRTPTGQRLTNLAKFFYVNEEYITCESDIRLIDDRFFRDTALSDFATHEQFIDRINILMNRLGKESLKEVYDLVRSLRYAELDSENSSN